LSGLSKGWIASELAEPYQPPIVSMNVLSSLDRYDRSQLIAIVAVCTLSIGLSAAASIALPYGIDWHEAFRPASLALLSGQSPYTVDRFYAAPWGLLPLLALSVLPENVGRGVLLTASILSLLVVARRLGARPPAVVAFLLSPPVVHGLLNANIDWLVMLGFVVPPQIGLLFVVIKPQMGIGLVVYWLIEAWREGGLPRTVRVFWPVALVTGVSFLLFGFWPLRFQGIVDYSENFNASLWPMSIPVGLALLAASIRRREPRYAIASSPCLAPHVVFHSYAGVLASLLPMTAETIAAVIGLWILVIIRAMTGA
jgi:hypothetical protein